MLLEMGVRVWLPQAPDVMPDTPLTVVRGTAAEPPATPAPAPRTPSPVPAAASAVERVPQPDGPTTPSPNSAAALSLQALEGDALVQAAAQCQACGLCAGRKNTTLYLPTPRVQTDWLVVGDPPDEDEDRQGRPFVEQSGQLLDNMLKAVGASRSGAARQGAYLSNVVKCRPPQGRLPQAAELTLCAQYLQREIALAQPKVILAMGRFAAQLLLAEHPEQTALPLGKQRGQVYRYQGIPVVVTYHPKVLLRASADKGKAWADLCLAMEVVQGGLQAPGCT